MATSHGVLAFAFLALGFGDAASARDDTKPRKKGDSPAVAAPPTSDEISKEGEAAGKAEGSAPKVDFSGVWTWTFRAPNGFVHEPTLRIRQKGSKLAGTIYGKRGGMMPVRDVRLTKDGKVAFTLDREFYGFPMEVKFIGKLEGDAISGKMGVQLNGDRKNTRVFDWDAHRVREDGRRPDGPPVSAGLAPRL